MALYISSSKFALYVDRQEIRKALRSVGKDLKTAAKAQIMSGGSGRQYGSHQASSPGEAPVSFTGALAASLKVSVRGTTLKVTDTQKYATSLEGGAKGGGAGKGGKSGASKRSWLRGRVATTSRVLEARPFLSTALEVMEPDIQAKLDAAFDKIIEGRTA
jgi:hypothetical protein